MRIELNDLIQYLCFDNSITYIGIGTAKNTEWTEQEDQQYPMFIREYQLKHPDIKINLVLIDPMLGKVTGLNFTPLSTVGNVYSTLHNTTYYLFNEKVYYEPELQREKPTHGKDITQLLSSLNEKCSHCTGILIVHDFSGNDMNLLNIAFKKQLETCHHKILYDLSDGVQVGCYLDMQDTVNHVVISKTASGIFINDIRGWTCDKLVKYLNNDAIKYTLLCKKIQRRTINIIKRYKEFYFNNLRRTMLWLKNIDTPNADLCQKVISLYDIKIMDIEHDTKLMNVYSREKIQRFVAIMEWIHEQKKHEVEVILGFKFNFDDPEPNNWLNLLNGVLE